MSTALLVWFIVLTVVFSATNLLVFWRVVAAMRSTPNHDQVIELGLGALALMLAGTILPWQFEVVVVKDSYRVVCGLSLILGFIYFAIAFCGHVGITHHRLNNRAQAEEKAGKATPPFPDVVTAWVTYILFFTAGLIWCIAFAALTAIVLLALATIVF